jgi:hypothetical protein
MAADSPIPAHRWPSGDPYGEALPRLVDQLHALSRVAENLTVRLLELEERFVDQESRLLPLIEAGPALDPAALEGMDLRLGETEERLAQLEDLLRDEDGRDGRRSVGHRLDRSLRAVPRALSLEAAEEPDFAAESDPFPEEGEQPFMDERIA